MPSKKIFGIDMDTEKHPEFKEDLLDATYVSKINEQRRSRGKEDLNYLQVQRYFLDYKKENGGLSPADEDIDKINKEKLDESLKWEIKNAVLAAFPSFQKKAEEVKKEEKRENVQEVKIEQKEEQKTKEKTDEKKTDDVAAEKEVKPTEAKPKEEVKQAEQSKLSGEKLNQNMNEFAENVEKTQKAIDKAVNGKKAKMSEGDVKATIEDFYKKLIYDDMQAQKGMLPADKYMQHLQDLQYARELDAQQNGGFEDYMMGQRADTLQNIGEEYQQNREVTPKLVEKVDALNSIDNVLTSITRNPKLLFITVLLMGLNPFMALGMAVLSAFGNAVVQDLYQKLPETDRSNLENRPAQQPVQEQQPAYNPKIEAYEKEMAKAQQKMKEQEEIIQGLKQDSAETARLSRQLLTILGAIRKENSKKARFKEEEQEKKKASEVKKEENNTEKEKRTEAEKKSETKKKETKETKNQPVLEKKDKLAKTKTSVLGG